jgi:acetyl esterase/lipase
VLLGGDLDLKLDIIVRRPMWLPSAWRPFTFTAAASLRRQGIARGRVKPFAALGMWRLPRNALAGQAGYPALVHDAKAAIRWARANAKILGIDPQRIGVAGYSAGGYHALFTAGTGDRPEFEGSGGHAGVSTKVAVCLAYYPATNVSTSMLPSSADASTRAAANATSLIAAGYPPVAIFHGMKDTTIPIESSKRLVQQFQDAGVPVEFHAFEGVPHAFDSNPEFAVLCAQLPTFSSTGTC